MFFVSLRRFNFSLQQFRKQTAVRQTRERVVESCVTEVVFGFFEDAADSFLLRNVVVEFQDVSFSLLSALMLNFSTGPFSFFSVTSRGFHFAHITVVAEVHNDDYRD